MNKTLRANFDNLRSKDRALQNQAYHYILKATDKPVDWAYEAWDELIQDLSHPDNHVRAIAAQVLCNLAKSDPAYRMRKDFKKLLAATKDERFVTARHSLQALWKVGVVGQPQQKQLVAGLITRYQECATEKNGTLIRYDILQSLRNVYDRVQDDNLRAKALELIEMEVDSKYRKKYATLWRGVQT